MTALRRILQPLDRIVAEHPDALALTALAISFALRLRLGAQTYLNPDEAHYFEMSLPNGIAALYQSALDTHHPALYIILMHWIGKVSQHELALRSVLSAEQTVNQQQPRWKTYVNAVLAAELSRLTRYCDRVIQWLPRADDRGTLLSLIDAPRKQRLEVGETFPTSRPKRSREQPSSSMAR